MKYCEERYNLFFLTIAAALGAVQRRIFSRAESRLEAAVTSKKRLGGHVREHFPKGRVPAACRGQVQVCRAPPYSPAKPEPETSARFHGNKKANPFPFKPSSSIQPKDTEPALESGTEAFG